MPRSVLMTRAYSLTPVAKWYRVTVAIARRLPSSRKAEVRFMSCPHINISAEARHDNALPPHCLRAEREWPANYPDRISKGDALSRRHEFGNV